MKTNLLLLAILYLLGTSSFAASNPFDDASAAYERGDYVQGMKLFRQLAAQGHLTDCDRDTVLFRVYVEGDGLVCHTGTKSCFTEPLSIKTVEASR